jgi:hypothetical protein
MHTVVVTMTSPADFADTVNEMRLWLDEQCCSILRFTYAISADTTILKVEFDQGQQAISFIQRFGGTNSGSVNLRRVQSPETMEQVCWWRLRAEEVRAKADQFTSLSARETMSAIALSYDRVAEDLEKLLANPRYRDGLWITCAPSSKGHTPNPARSNALSKVA